MRKSADKDSLIFENTEIILISNFYALKSSHKALQREIA